MIDTIFDELSDDMLIADARGDHLTTQSECHSGALFIRIPMHLGDLLRIWIANDSVVEEFVKDSCVQLQQFTHFFLSRCKVRDLDFVAPVS